MRTALLTILLLVGCAGPHSAVSYQDGGIDWEAEGEACVELLQQLLRIDTTNPPAPGSKKKHAGETALCRHVRKLLQEDGIPSEILESAPGRGNLVARLKGDGSKKPLLLMAHVDVVGVDRDKWIEDPFAGVVRNGTLHGRGALDDKGMASVLTHVLRMLKRSRVRLSRDVILMLNADEESGGNFGARWMVENHFDRIDAELVLNEGGRITESRGKIVQVAVQSAEKVYNDVRLWIRGDSGHSSVPLPNNSIYALAGVLEKLRAYRRPIRLTETVRAYLRGVSRLATFAKNRELVLAAADGDVRAAELLADINPRLSAVFRTTFVPTVVGGGIRENVLPPDAWVNLNIRLLPGDDLDSLLEDLAIRAGLDDYEIVDGKKFGEWKRTQEENRRAGRVACDAAFVIDLRDAEAPASPLESPLMEAIRKISKRMAPDVPIVPFMSTGATDSRWLRARGKTCYGLLPLPVTEEENKTLHDHNERVRVRSVRFGVEFTYRLVLEAAR